VTQAQYDHNILVAENGRVFDKVAPILWPLEQHLGAGFADIFMRWFFSAPSIRGAVIDEAEQQRRLHDGL